jgi:hypothetical protein
LLPATFAWVSRYVVNSLSAEPDFAHYSTGPGTGRDHGYQPPLTPPQEVKVGLAADIGTLQRLPKVVGNGSKARELALTGRQFGAAEAKELGFVSDVVQGSRKEVVGE